MTRVLVVVPAYNEEEALGGLLGELAATTAGEGITLVPVVRFSCRINSRICA